MSHDITSSPWNADRSALLIGSDPGIDPSKIIVTQCDGTPIPPEEVKRLLGYSGGSVTSFPATVSMPIDQIINDRPTAQARRGRRSPTLLTALAAAAMAMGVIAPGIDRVRADLPDEIPLPAPGKRRRLFKPKVKGSCGKCGKKRRNCRCR